MITKLVLIHHFFFSRMHVFDVIIPFSTHVLTSGKGLFVNCIVNYVNYAMHF